MLSRIKMKKIYYEAYWHYPHWFCKLFCQTYMTFQPEGNATTTSLFLNDQQKPIDTVTQIIKKDSIKRLYMGVS